MTAQPKPSELLDRMRRVAVKDPIQVIPAEPSDGSRATAMPGSTGPTPTADRVRYTIDLVRPQHRFLKRFALEQDADVSAVLRAVLRLMEHDPVFADRVVDELVSSSDG